MDDILSIYRTSLFLSKNNLLNVVLLESQVTYRNHLFKAGYSLYILD